MADPEKPEQAPEDLPAGEGASIGVKGRRSLSKSRRELTEEEQAQSGVRLMMLDEMDRLDLQVKRLEVYEERFHAVDKHVSVLEERRQRDIAIDVVHAVCVGFGVGFLMLIPTLPTQPSGQRWYSALVGGVLLIAGIAVKLRRR